MRRITFTLAGVAALMAAVHVAGAPGPVAADGPPDDAIDFFKRYIALSNRYDARLGDLYADSAVLRVTTRLADGSSREVQLTGEQYKALLPQAVVLAKGRGEKTVFFDIRYSAEGERMRVTATRYDTRGNYHAPHTLVLARDAGAGWVIVEEAVETQADPAAMAGADLAPDADLGPASGEPSDSDARDPFAGPPS
jgi:hypothetical protein